jgi:hypothetical protein
MSDEDDRDGHKVSKLPAVQDTAKVPASRYDAGVPRVAGGVDAALTGWRARAAARSYGDIKQALAATDGAVQAGIALKRTLGALADLDATLDDDQAERDEDRAARAHAREQAARQRQRDVAARDYEDQKAIWAQEKELADLHDQAIFAQRRLEAALKTKDLYVEGTVAKVATEGNARAIKHITSAEALARRQQQITGRYETGRPPLDPDLVKLLDDDTKDATANREPVEVFLRLGKLRAAAQDETTFLAALDEQIRLAREAEEPWQVMQRLTAIRALFDEPGDAPAADKPAP